MFLPTEINLPIEIDNALKVLYRLQGLNEPTDEKSARHIIQIGQEMQVAGARLAEIGERWLDNESRR